MSLANMNVCLGVISWVTGRDMNTVTDKAARVIQRWSAKHAGGPVETRVAGRASPGRGKESRPASPRGDGSESVRLA